MTSLIARLEALSGPDRGTADEVLLACGWSYDEIPHQPGAKDRRPLRYWIEPSGDKYQQPHFRPDPTASIDAALTLKPEQYRLSYLAERQFDIKTCEAELMPWGSTLAGDERTGIGASLAIALCIAVLRARGIE